MQRGRTTTLDRVLINVMFKSENMEKVVVCYYN